MSIDNEEQDSLAEAEEKKLDPTLEKLIDFLQTDKGEKVFAHVMSALGRHTQRSAFISLIESLVKYAIVGGVIYVVYLLSDSAKFDGAIGVLLGTLVGYLFGKQKP